MRGFRAILQCVSKACYLVVNVFPCRKDSYGNIFFAGYTRVLQWYKNFDLVYKDIEVDYKLLRNDK
jgi:hypothetical protein